MGLNFNLDYSTLFSGFSSGMGMSSSGGFSLADYASIKNGSYLKLTKAYYSKNSAGKTNEGFNSTSTGKDTVKSLTDIEQKADQLKDSADALIAKGSKSLFQKKDITTTAEDGTKTTTKDYDRDAIYKGVKSFVEDYNALIKSAGNSSSTNILRQTLSLTSYTNAYSNTLANAGITIGKDNKLTIDEEAFKESDMSTLKTLFNDANSYAYTVSAKASQINFYANSEASKANTYNFNGSFSNNHNSGNLYNSYF